jgi:hypothetical protein
MTNVPVPKPQAEKFEDLAREVEADEDEAPFEEAVWKIAPKDRPAPEKAD